MADKTRNSFEPPQDRWRQVSYPIRSGLRGAWAMVDGTNAVKESLRNILLTKKGQRVMLYDYGSDLWQLLFEPNDMVLASLARVYAREAIKKWEDRIFLQGIRTAVQNEKLVLFIAYYYKATKTPDSLELVIPLRRANAIG